MLTNPSLLLLATLVYLSSSFLVFISTLVYCISQNRRIPFSGPSQQPSRKVTLYIFLLYISLTILLLFVVNNIIPWSLCFDGDYLHYNSSFFSLAQSILFTLLILPMLVLTLYRRLFNGTHTNLTLWNTVNATFFFVTITFTAAIRSGPLLSMLPIAAATSSPDATFTIPTLFVNYVGIDTVVEAFSHYLLSPVPLAGFVPLSPETHNFLPMAVVSILQSPNLIPHGLLTAPWELWLPHLFELSGPVSYFRPYSNPTTGFVLPDYDGLQLFVSSTPFISNHLSLNTLTSPGMGITSIQSSIWPTSTKVHLYPSSKPLEVFNDPYPDLFNGTPYEVARRNP